MNPRLPPVGETELIARLRSGDAAAQTAVVRQYQCALVHHASRVLRDRDLAEDVVQETWLAAFACIDSFNPRSSLFAWLVTIVINRARGLLRREVRSLPFSAWVTRTVGPPGDDELELPALICNDVSPERLLLEREALQRFNDALQGLPERQRTVLFLRDFAGASSAETCRVLGINDLTQRVRLCRARASIREALQRPDPPSRRSTSRPEPSDNRVTRQRQGDICPTPPPAPLKAIRRLAHGSIGLVAAMAI